MGVHMHSPWRMAAQFVLLAVVGIQTVSAAIIGTQLVPPPNIIRADFEGPSANQFTTTQPTPEPKLPGETLTGPMSTAIDPKSGALLVADTENNQVLRCVEKPQGLYGDLAYECIILAGGCGLGAGACQFWSPYGFHLSNSTGQLFVADTLNSRIQRYEPSSDSDGPMDSPSTVINGSDSSRPEHKIEDPVAVVLDEQRGLLYVADTANHRIQRFSLNSKEEVIAGGVTIAGVSYVSGTALNMFDNPTALHVEHETMTLWVADARNKRVMRWDYGASEGVEEVSNLTGRPYGVTTFQGAVYFSDADECVVWKRMITGTEKVIVAGGRKCGAEMYQLSFPAGVTVDKEGGVIVADASNDRIVRWAPDPSWNEVVCTLAEPCQISLKDGNPIASNLVVVIALPEDPIVTTGTTTTTSSYSGPPINPCAGTCLASGFFLDKPGLI